MKVFIIAALTIDGFIAEQHDQLADWTSKEDKQLFVKLTKEAGTMIMGSRTFKTIGRALPERQTIVYSREPESEPIENVTVTSEDPRSLITRLEQEGVTSVAICGGASIYTLFLESGLVTDLYITIEPLVFGSGVTLFNKPLLKQFQLASSEKLNENVILQHYQILES